MTHFDFSLETRQHFVFTVNQFAVQYLLRDDVISYLISRVDYLVDDFYLSIPEILDNLCLYIHTDQDWNKIIELFEAIGVDNWNSEIAARNITRLD